MFVQCKIDGFSIDLDDRIGKIVWVNCFFVGASLIAPLKIASMIPRVSLTSFDTFRYLLIIYAPAKRESLQMGKNPFQNEKNHFGKGFFVLWI